MGFFDQAKDIMKLRSQAKEIEKKLKKIHVEAEEAGVSVVVNGKQELVSVTISDELAGDPRRIEKNIVAAMGRANKKAQEVSAQEMQSMMGGLGGLMGGGA